MAKAPVKRQRSTSRLIQRSRGVSAEQKAAYHQVEGTGRSRTLRPFVGLTADDEAHVQQRLEALIDGVIQRRS